MVACEEGPGGERGGGCGEGKIGWGLGCKGRGRGGRLGRWGLYLAYLAFGAGLCACVHDMALAL